MTARKKMLILLLIYGSIAVIVAAFTLNYVIKNMYGKSVEHNHELIQNNTAANEQLAARAKELSSQADVFRESADVFRF